MPNLQQIHRAAAKAKEGATNSEHPERFILKCACCQTLHVVWEPSFPVEDYEALSLTDMLRIPVLQQQFRLGHKVQKVEPTSLAVRKLTATLGNLSSPSHSSRVWSKQS